jgi:hypothetical protein
VAAARVVTGAPAYTLDRSVRGLRVGLRHEGSWRSWLVVVAEWERYLVDDGAVPVVVAAGGRVGAEGRRTRADVARWAETVDCGIAGLGTCGSCTANSVHDAAVLEALGKPAAVAVCSEFAQHGRAMARAVGHPDLKHLVLPYPMEGLPDDEVRAIARDHYPAFLRLLGDRSRA